MNYKILSKVLQELGKDKPDLSYIKGMVETLIAMQPDVLEQVKVTPPVAPVQKTMPDMSGIPPLPISMAAIKDLTAKSVQIE